MRFNIILFEGTDIIKFGMSSQEVQSLLEARPTFFKKAEYIPEVEDYGGKCHVYYDADGKCEAIELFPPSEVYYENASLMGESRSMIKEFFSMFEDNIENTSVIGLKNSEFSVYIPDTTVESVYLARKGYKETVCNLYNEYTKKNPEAFSQLLVSHKNSIMQLMKLTGKNRLVIGDIIRGANDCNTFEEVIKKIKANNAKIDSHISFLVNYYRAGDEFLNAGRLSTIQEEYMQMIEKAYEMFCAGEVETAKEYLLMKNKVVQIEFMKVYDFFSGGFVS